MAIAWPVSLQQKVNQDSFTLNMGDTTIRSDMDIGPAKIRRRFTKSVDTFSVTIDLLFSDYSVLYNFYDISLNGGVHPFELSHPITGVLTEFRFTGPPSFRPMGGGYFKVSMTWEALPL